MLRRELTKSAVIHSGYSQGEGYCGLSSFQKTTFSEKVESFLIWEIKEEKLRFIIAMFLLRHYTHINQ